MRLTIRRSKAAQNPHLPICILRFFANCGFSSTFALPPTVILRLPPTVILRLPPTVILRLPPTVILRLPPTVILRLPPTVILRLPPTVILREAKRSRRIHALLSHYSICGFRDFARNDEQRDHVWNDEQYDCARNDEQRDHVWNDEQYDCARNDEQHDNVRHDEQHDYTIFVRVSTLSFVVA